MSIAARKEGDPETLAKARIYARLHELFEGSEINVSKSFTAHEVLAKWDDVLKHEDLPNDAEHLGKWLSNRRDSQAGGYVLRKLGICGSTRRAVWQVVKTEAE